MENEYLVKRIKRKENIEYISGPVIWTYFKLNNIDLHFFGDIHGSTAANCEDLYDIKCSKGVEIIESKCLSIENLFYRLFESEREKYIDLFLELPYRVLKDQKDETKDSDYISIIEKVFFKCFTREKKDCKYNPYVRFHYTNIRATNEEEIPVDLYSLIAFIVRRYIHLFIDKLDMKPYSRGNVLDGLNTILDQLMSTVIFYEDDQGLYYESEDIFIVLKGMKERLSNLVKEEGIDLINPSWYRKMYRLVKRQFEKQYIFSKEREGKKVHMYKAEVDQIKKMKLKMNGIDIGNAISKFVNDSMNISKFNLNQEYNKFVALMNKYNEDHDDYEQIKRLEKGEMSEKEDKKVLESELLKVIVKMEYELLNMGGLLMDGYTLSRIFKTMKYEGKPSMILNYSGLHHVLNYKRFFTKYLNLDPEDEVEAKIIDKKLTRCLYNPDFNKIFVI